MRNYIKNSLLDLVETHKELCGEILREYESRHEEYKALSHSHAPISNGL